MDKEYNLVVGFGYFVNISVSVIKLFVLFVEFVGVE